jgi:hypothetical protein
MNELAKANFQVTGFISSQSLLYGLLYGCELASKSASSLLTFSSTTESLVDPKVRAISTEDILLSLIVAGFLLLRMPKIFRVVAGKNIR